MRPWTRGTSSKLAGHSREWHEEEIKQKRLLHAELGEFTWGRERLTAELKIFPGSSRDVRAPEMLTMGKPKPGV